MTYRAKLAFDAYRASLKHPELHVTFDMLTDEEQLGWANAAQAVASDVVNAKNNVGTKQKTQ